MNEVISDKELVRRVRNGERPHVVKLGPDRWQVQSERTGA